jgi:hypothetical protein
MKYLNLAHDRKCKLCKIDIEDECHFLLQCPKLEIEKKAFLELINKEYKNFNSLEVNNKFIWLMSSDGFCVFPLGCTVYGCWQYHIPLANIDGFLIFELYNNLYKC